MESKDFGIGSSVWIFNINRRVYARDSNGRSSGGLIWLEHWEHWSVVSETSRSWVLKNGVKLPKNGEWSSNVAVSMEDIKKIAWVKENGRKIADKVARIDNHELLLQIAEIINYKETTK